MRRRHRVNLLLAFIVGALGAALWLSKAARDAGPGLPAGLASGEIRTIELARPGSDPVRLERKKRGWRLVQPFELQADPERVARLLELLADMPAKPVAAEGLDPARFGLEPPRASIRIDDTELRVGDAHPYNPQRYVAIDRGVFLAADRFGPLLAADATSFLSRSPLPAGTRVTALETPAWRLERDVSGTWRETAGGRGLPARAARLAADFEDWLFAEAAEVRPWQGGGKATPLEVSVAGAEEPLAFAFDRAGGTRLLARPGLGIAYLLPDTGAPPAAPPQPPEE